jgi:hypothetical protein
MSNSALQGRRLLLSGEHWFIFQNAKIFPVQMVAWGLMPSVSSGYEMKRVTRITRRAANTQRHALMDSLRRAQMEVELDARTNIESLADFFEATLAGIRIAAKAGKTLPALRRIAEVASGTFADVKSSVLSSRDVKRTLRPSGQFPTGNQ